MPITLRDGTYFGTLCALDFLPVNFSDDVLENFYLFADLIAFELAADKQLRQREAELREAERIGELREKLFGILGHDLRNPLSTIKIATLLFPKNEQNEKVVGKIINSANRMERMIKDLLDLTRTRLGGGIPIERKLVDLKVVFSQSVEEFAAANPLTRFEFSAEGDFTGEWDADRLAQIASNLIGNAVDYGAPDTPIRIILRGDETNATVSVQNYGEPIPPEQLENLFNPYRRAIVSGHKSSSKSLGLGLYIVQQIAAAHKGQIAVTSNAADGTVFTITLPRR